MVVVGGGVCDRFGAPVTSTSGSVSRVCNNPGRGYSAFLEIAPTCDRTTPGYVHLLRHAWPTPATSVLKRPTGV